MGMTLAEKILAKTGDKPDVTPGDIVWANVQTAMMDDILGPRIEIAEKMQELGASIWDKDKVVVVLDHYSPAANVKQAEILKFTREWAQSQNVKYYEGEGPCHQVLCEKGHIVPGTVAVATDSHTCTYGALGAFGTGIGSTEMVGVLATGKIWLKVPESIFVEWKGSLTPGVYAKDMVLKTIGDIGHAGATYKVLEFAGSTVKALSLDERMCLSNMAVEAGAKAGLIEPDEKVMAWVKEHGIKDYEFFHSDANAKYIEKLLYNSEQLVPQVACPHKVDAVKDVDKLGEVTIDQAYVGSCTGGRYDDLVAAEKMIRGRKVAPHVRMLVSPASTEIYEKALKNGLLQSFVAAGARILPPTCGICLGLHSGILAAGERVFLRLIVILSAEWAVKRLKFIWVRQQQLPPVPLPA